MIKALIFDVSGVLTHARFPHAFEAFAHKINLPSDLVADYFKNDLEKQLLGQSNLHDIYVSLSEKLDEISETAFKEKWVSTIAEITTINEDLLGWIDTWRKAYTCGILTNNTEGRGIFDQHIQLHSHFDFALESYKEHIKKPNPEFFKLGLQYAKCAPNEALYVDDQQRHVDAAISVGMQGILFTNNEQLRQDLISHGIKI
ncbi:MAG: HAD-IA family hydrolase [Candidatus Doudnabacteria bacterium]|nr:HAD-IA family hydrolase [Candidatus Doudnabacteria bacterium]